MNPELYPQFADFSTRFQTASEKLINNEEFKFNAGDIELLRTIEISSKPGFAASVRNERQEQPLRLPQSRFDIARSIGSVFCGRNTIPASRERYCLCFFTPILLATIVLTLGMSAYAVSPTRHPVSPQFIGPLSVGGILILLSLLGLRHARSLHNKPYSS